MQKKNRIKMSFIPWSIASSRALRRSISCLLALFLTESVYKHGRPSELLPARHCHRLLRRLDFALGLCRLRLRQRRSLGAGGVRQPRRGGHRRRRRERRDTGAGCIGETELSTVLWSIHSLPGWLVGWLSWVRCLLRTV